MASTEAGDTTSAEIWEFAGWGEARRMTDLAPAAGPAKDGAGHKLGQWPATAICGNDITSSCLYVSALASLAAGPLAPIVLVIVAGVLFFFRSIYAEVGSALPLNGGTYTLLLNSTNKKFAAAAACLTLLSYVATAVISAGEAMHYAHELISQIDVFWATIALLAVFAALNVVGITESSIAALAIFIFHMATLVILSGASIFVVSQDFDTFLANWSLPPPGGLAHALFFGFAAAMLGISGFESSANFIEEQKAGVFPKTLRNMWLAVALFNPLLSFLALGLVPLGEMEAYKTSLLAQMGHRAAGPWLAVLVSIDAVLVLSGAVLTSYVGVTGLVRRMSLDRCLPQVLLKQNRWRRTNHWIILGFLALCCSIFFITEGDVGVLAGVYTLSFLMVMALFAVGNMLLKVVRRSLPRKTRASWPVVVIALSAVCVGLAGNITEKNLEVFATYLLAVGGAVAIMFLRVPLLRVLLFVSKGVVDRVTKINDWLATRVRREVKRINQLGVVYFTKGDDLPTLNRAALYVLQNEQTHLLTVVHAFKEEADVPPELASHLATVDRLYPQLRINFLAVKGVFGPELIEALSLRLGIPKNYMFIGTPGDRFPHQIATLGGVRLIL
jgi:amino acid transporter